MDEPKDEFWDAEEPGIFDHAEPDAVAASDARAIADIEAGRVISNEAVMRWLTDFINGKRSPRPQPGD